MLALSYLTLLYSTDKNQNGPRRSLRTTDISKQQQQEIPVEMEVRQGLNKLGYTQPYVLINNINSLPVTVNAMLHVRCTACPKPKCTPKQPPKQDAIVSMFHVMACIFFPFSAVQCVRFND